MKTPPCFDSDRQLVSWLELNIVSHGGVTAKKEMMASGYCRDCTAEYAKKMRKLGRCSQPQVVFDRTAEGEMVGVGFKMEVESEIRA